MPAIQKGLSIMPEEELRVVLARLDERIRSLVERIISLEKALAEKVSAVEGRIDDVEDIQAKRMCSKNEEKFNQLEWFMRIILGTSLAALVKAFWFTGGKA